MTKHLSPPKAEAQVTVDWLEGGPYTDGSIRVPQNEVGARLYCATIARRVPDLDYQAIEDHSIELAKRGMDEDWIYLHLTTCCQGRWTKLSSDSDIVRDRFKAAVQRGLRLFDTYTEAYMATPAGDGLSLQERYKAKQWLEYKDLPPPGFLVENLIAKRTQFMVYGQPKVGKTFFALSLALSLACCYFVPDFCGLKTDGQRVLYIIAEGSEEEFRNRIEAWIRATVNRLAKTPAARKELRDNLDEAIHTYFHRVFVRVPIDLEDHVKALLEANPGTTLIAPGWDLVVVDTMFRNMNGDVMKPQDSAAFGRGVDYIRDNTDAAVMVLAHETKTGGSGVFGSILTMANADGTAKISIGKDDSERIFSIEQLRNASDSQPDIVYQLPIVALQDLGTSCALEFVERRAKGKTKAKEDGRTKNEDAIMIFLSGRKPTDGKLSIAKIADRTGVSKSKAERRIAYLRDQGYIEESGYDLTKKGRAAIEALTDDGSEES